MLRAVRFALRRLLGIRRVGAPDDVPFEREVPRTRPTMADVPLVFAPPAAVRARPAAPVDVPPAPADAPAAMPAPSAAAVDAPSAAPAPSTPVAPLASPPPAPPPVTTPPVATPPAAVSVASPVASPPVVVPRLVAPPVIAPPPAAAPSPAAPPPAAPPPAAPSPAGRRPFARPSAPPPRAPVVAAPAESAYAPPVDDGVTLGTEAQLALLRELAPVARTFAWPDQRGAERRFWTRNGVFQHGDAALLYAMLRRLRPRHLVAVGAGPASALILDVNERELEHRMQLTFVEPTPKRIDGLLRDADRANTQVVRARVQDVPGETFDALQAGDLLFVQSSPDATSDGDLAYLLFRVLPHLRTGVVVHLPDVIWPFEHLDEARRAARAPHDLHLVHAFLQYNLAFEILLFGSQLAMVCGDVATRLVPQLAIDSGGSLWLRRTAHR